MGQTPSSALRLDRMTEAELRTHLKKNDPQLHNTCCEGRTPLAHAARLNRVDLMKVLIEDLGAEPLARTVPQRECLLHHAARFGAVEAAHYCLEHYPSMAALFDDNGETFLHYAASAGSGAVCVRAHQLLGAADFLACSEVRRVRDGRVPLHLAVMANEKDCVRVLLELGVDPTIADKSGYVSVDLATSNKVKKMLQKALVSNDVLVRPKSKGGLGHDIQISQSATSLSSWDRANSASTSHFDRLRARNSASDTTLDRRGSASEHSYPHALSASALAAGPSSGGSDSPKKATAMAGSPSSKSSSPRLSRKAKKRAPTPVRSNSLSGGSLMASSGGGSGSMLVGSSSSGNLRPVGSERSVASILGHEFGGAPSSAFLTLQDEQPQ